MQAIDKPSYRIPCMAEIAAVESNGLTVVSTFAGCGGSSLGYRMAGFRLLWASEFIAAARDVYERNAAPGTVVDARDIRTVSPDEILDAIGLKAGELDVLDGSPPCSSFSTAGRREQDWGKSKKYSDTKQRTDDLFFEFARILRGLQPRTFVAENVSGLVKGTAKGYFLEILAALKGCGYRVEARLLDAQWLGVPQQRQRIIFVGVREDLAAAPAFPKPLPYRYSVREAIPWIGSVVHDTSGLYGAGEVIDRPSPTVTVGVNSVNAQHFKVLQRFEVRVVPGDRGSRRRREEGKDFSLDEPISTVVANGGRSTERAQFMIEGATGYDKHAPVSPDEPMPTIMAGRPVNVMTSLVLGGGNARPNKPGNSFPRNKKAALDDPCPTIMAAPEIVGSAPHELIIEPEDAAAPSPSVTASGGDASKASVTHPTERRKFSIAELKRICAFPDDFIMTGTYAQQWERLGRAVPPLMMRAIATTLRDEVLDHVRNAGKVRRGPRVRRRGSARPDRPPRA